MTTDELRELLAKVTPGPWRDMEGAIQSQSTWWDEHGVEHRDWSFPRILAQVTDDWDQFANARLIALAPSLAAEVLRLREAISGLETENAALLHDLKRQMTIANVECNEAARLREMVEANFTQASYDYAKTLTQADERESE